MLQPNSQPCRQCKRQFIFNINEPKKKVDPPLLLKKKTNSLHGRKRIRLSKTLHGLGLHSVFLQQQQRQKKKKKNEAEEEEEEGNESIERGND
jgi:hypothetical protein